MAAAVCPPGLPWGAKYYTDVGGVCTRDTSFFGGKPVLNQGVGYAVVLGFGAIFALATSFLVRMRAQNTWTCSSEKLRNLANDNLYFVSVRLRKTLENLRRKLNKEQKKLQLKNSDSLPFVLKLLEEIHESWLVESLVCENPLENSLQKSNVKCLFCDYNNKQVWLEKKYVGSRHNSEWFNTAGRNIKTGLIASVIVSQVCCWGSQSLRLRNSGTISIF
jgi:hypothetical protein